MLTSAANRPPRILIVGGGIAGLVMAILLERRQYEVTLVEHCREWLPVGGGITLTLNGVRMLRAIGLLDKISPGANEIRTILITDKEGNVLSSFRPEEYAAAYGPTLTIHRHELHSILLSHLAGTGVRTGTDVYSIVNEVNGVSVTLSDGVAERYDLVIGCDGIDSAVREMVFGGGAKQYSGYVSWRFLARDLAGVDTTTIKELWGRGKRFGIVPLNDSTIHCFASANTTDPARYKHISVAGFKELFGEFDGEVQNLIATVKSEEAFMYNALEDVTIGQWHRGRVVLIGDAAHGMTPNMTQGASMAIEDAYTLAAKLDQHTEIDKALAAFYAARSERVRTIQKRSRLLGRIGQLEKPLLCSIRDYCWKNIPDKWLQSDLKELLITGMPALT